MAARLDAAIGRLIHFEYKIIDPVLPALEDDSFFPMAHALNAYLGGLSTDPQIISKYTHAFDSFRQQSYRRSLTRREQGHLLAAAAMLAGNLSAAARTLADISLSYPRDMIALAIGHQIDLLVGDIVSLQDRIGAALPFWRDADPHYPALLAMYAFGLEENGHWSLSEDVGTRAADLDPENVWAIHAVAHSLEMRARCGQGVRWLDSHRDCWDTYNQIRSHIWWHYCLYLLETDDIGSVLSIYDHSMAPDKIDHALPKLTNGSSILWRLYLQGADVGDRFRALADLWRPRVSQPWCVFNDMHAVMCYAGSGDFDEAMRLIADRKKYIMATARQIDNVVTTAEIGLPVCKALLAFGRGRHDEAFDLLYPIRRRIFSCGGSHAQRDVIQQTLVRAAIGAGRGREARGLIGERIAIRPERRFNWIKNDELAAQGHTTWPMRAT